MGAGSAMPNEIELKLRIATADIARLSRHPALLRYLAGQPLTRRLTSIYFDTPDLQLLNAAISLRVRHMAGGWFQAVKGAGHSLAGLHQRMEWEDIISGDQPDFDKITEPGLAAIFADPALRRALCPIFITDVERTEWQLVFEDGSTIEAALDRGELQPGMASADWPSENICELELELKHGNASHIFELSLAIQAHIPLQIENVIKAQRGYAHFRPSVPPSLPSLLPEALPTDMTAEVAFRQLAGLCLQQLQNGHELLDTDIQPLAVAAMRTACERLHFLLKLFGLQQDEVRKALKQAIALLEAAHGWHIFADEILPAFPANLPQSDRDLLQQRSLDKLAHALQRLRQRLDSQRQQRLLLQLGACLAADLRHADAKAVLRSSLQRNDRKLRNLMRHLPTPGINRLRKLRRRIDRLRYGAALLGFGPRSVAEDAYVKGLAEVSSALTALHDAKLAALLPRRLHVSDDGFDTMLDSIAACHADQLAGAGARMQMACQALSSLPLS